jgi:hypothetical protein
MGESRFMDGHADWAKEPGNLASNRLPEAVQEAIQDIPNDYAGENRKKILLVEIAAGGLSLRGHSDEAAIEFPALKVYSKPKPRRR